MDILGRRYQYMRTEGLSRFLIYVLGRRPDEFGLVPDSQGFVTFKELLQALHEEEGWRHVRQSHINEILMGTHRSLFETEADRIRSVERLWEAECRRPALFLPKILFTPIRRRAHAAVMEKGLKGHAGRPVILSADRETALRIGRRRDPDPVLLEVRAAAAKQSGILFHAFGDLFLGPEIPAPLIAGPQPPKEVAEIRKGKEKPAEKRPRTQPSLTPGTFVLDPARDPDRTRKAKGKKRKGWKEAARKMRKTSKR